MRSPRKARRWERRASCCLTASKEGNNRWIRNLLPFVTLSDRRDRTAVGIMSFDIFRFVLWAATGIAVGAAVGSAAGVWLFADLWLGAALGAVFGAGVGALLGAALTL